jgi:hypothetical protein
MADRFMRRNGVGGAIRLGAALALILWPATGRPQSEVKTEIKPLVEQKLEPRSEAAITIDAESALVDKGYVKIATISARQPGEKRSEEGAKLLAAVILKKAAEAGGDVVRLEMDAAAETAEVPTGEIKKACIHSHFAAENPQAEVCDEWKETAITKKETDLVSSGTVWRNDVALSAIRRKNFAEVVLKSAIAQMGGKPINGLDITTEGPDNTLYVLHGLNMTSAACATARSEALVAALRDLGFTKLVCTDNKNATFSFDVAALPSAVGAARKEFAANNRQSAIEKIGPSTAAQLNFNITAEGPSATYYVLHEVGVTSAICSGMLGASGFTPKLRELGFIKLVCTDGANATFTFDLPK